MPHPTATLCAIVRDEGPFLLEWIAYQRVVAFDELLIYDNESSDVGREILRDLAAAGMLRLREWPSKPGVSPQLSCYADALTRIETDFVAFMDVDEFLNLHKHETVGDWLSGFPEETGAIAINWRVFGSADRQVFDPAPVMVRFTRCASATFYNNKHLKYFARPHMVTEAHIHYCSLKPGGLYLTADADRLQMSRLSFSDTISLVTAQINHYVLKSREEFEWKRWRGNAHRPPESPTRFTTRDKPEYWRELDKNEEEDTSILKRLDETLAEMDRLSTYLTAKTRRRLQRFLRSPRERARTVPSAPEAKKSTRIGLVSRIRH